MGSVERVYQAISRKDRQTTNCQSVTLGWTEYCVLINGKWASSFGFEMLCISVGQINRKGCRDSEQDTGPLSDCYRSSLLAAARVVDFFMG